MLSTRRRSSRDLGWSLVTAVAVLLLVGGPIQPVGSERPRLRTIIAVNAGAFLLLWLRVLDRQFLGCTRATVGGVFVWRRGRGGTRNEQALLGGHCARTVLRRRSLLRGFGRCGLRS
jgi:hypothetical protein